MRQIYTILLIIICMGAELRAGILEVGPGKTYATVQAAAQQAQPGDTILVSNGTHTGGEYIANLQGAPDAWITIAAETPGSVIYSGGGTAWQFSDAAYLVVSGFTFTGQTANGVNIDDGGTYDSPSHSIVIENCEFQALNATGNNDQLKLSGVDTFSVRGCWFTDGSPGGSCIDMVGCHYGAIEENYFINAGSNCIQAKGGTAYLSIQKNAFIGGGERSINIGGSTGLQFFRPLGINYEAAYIGVYANLFYGAVAPIAYVGAVFSEVVNNTIVLPEKWAIRILQETTDPGFLACGNNRFTNNIVYLDSQADSPTLNIGPNTSPQSFLFENNMWFNADDANWSGPNLPVAESNGILNIDPELNDIASGDYMLKPTSFAIGRGVAVSYPQRDYDGFLYASPRSIGGYEGNRTPTGVRTVAVPHDFLAAVYPNPASATANLLLDARTPGYFSVSLHDAAGRTLALLFDGFLSNSATLSVTRGALPAGAYFVAIRGAATQRTIPVRFVK